MFAIALLNLQLVGFVEEGFLLGEICVEMDL